MLFGNNQAVGCLLAARSSRLPLGGWAAPAFLPWYPKIGLLDFLSLGFTAFCLSVFGGSCLLLRFPIKWLFSLPLGHFCPKYAASPPPISAFGFSAFLMCMESVSDLICCLCAFGFLLAFCLLCFGDPYSLGWADFYFVKTCPITVRQGGQSPPLHPPKKQQNPLPFLKDFAKK